MPRVKGTVSALAPWFGAKRTLADRIVEEIGEHRVYWEPFCGSMAVLFAKSPVSFETVNDLHGDLVNLARVVQDEALCGRLYWRLRCTIPAEALFRESLAKIRSEPCSQDKGPQLDRAYHYFVISWLGRNGIAGISNDSTSFCKRYGSTGGSPGTRFISAVESLPPWHERLRGVVVLSCDGIELCEKIEDKAGTVIYVDPPYFAKGAKYLYDFNPEHHERLAAALHRFKNTRVVLSYYAHPEVDRLYPSWRRVDVATTKALVNTGKREAGGVTVAPEVILVNDKE